MGSLASFLFVYVLGGLTFVPLIIFASLLHAHLTFPIHEETAERQTDQDSIVQPGDDLDAIKRAQRRLETKSWPRHTIEADVSAGYFTICREYVPGGNGRPPIRTTPIGATTVTVPSPSVYQSMYRSIFDRRNNNSPLDNKSNGRPPKGNGNVFYVVLRHGHLMLFDDDQQLEVRHVISLAHHIVGIYSGGDETPEGELFIKRNALSLSRKYGAGELTPDDTASKPFFLFSENCSEKEDFYFAMLRNKEQTPDAKDNPPIPLQYNIKDIITLVQRLHSSEEHLQTRWLNAIIGRIFLALYKTPEVENFIRAKITKKISRVKTPSFLSNISLRNIDLGESAPFITNPRLKELTVDGDLVVEADVRYTGNFRIEVAAIARIELGSRFKAREVSLLLAVVLKRLEGHIMIRVKPPPSNRFWVTFQTMPKIDMTIEPIVSSRQITYTLILRQIENRIKEVVAESLVFPNWDDSPFYQSDTKPCRGGIWADDSLVVSSNDLEHADQHADPHYDGSYEEQVEEASDEAIVDLPHVEKSLSMPATAATAATSLNTAYPRKAAQSTVNPHHTKSIGSSTSIETHPVISEKPRALRSGSFTGVSSPIVGTDSTTADAFKPSTPPEQGEHSHAMAAMAAMAALPQNNTPIYTPTDYAPVGSPSHSHGSGKSENNSLIFPHGPEHPGLDSHNDILSQPPSSASDINTSSQPSSFPPSPATASLKSDTRSTRSFSSFSWDRRRDGSSSTSTLEKPPISESKRLSLANAAAQAKKWGWNAIQRHGEQKADTVPEDTASQSRPLVMGRGQPLPPPGVPLPPPSKRTKTAPIPVPKRKLVPPSPLLPKSVDSTSKSNGTDMQRHPVLPPPLPKRRGREDSLEGDDPADDGLLVVAAPTGDSEPTTPLSEHAPTCAQPWVEDSNETEDENLESLPINTGHKPSNLPKRRPHRVISSSPEEDGSKLPTWLAAQEEETRAKSNFVDEDSGV